MENLAVPLWLPLCTQPSVDTHTHGRTTMTFAGAARVLAALFMGLSLVAGFTTSADAALIITPTETVGSIQQTLNTPCFFSGNPSCNDPLGNAPVSISAASGTNVNSNSFTAAQIIAAIGS